MMTFKKAAAQGEISIRRVGPLPTDRTIPAGYSEMLPERGVFVVGKSETHHDHVLDAGCGSIAVMDKPPEGMRVLLALIEKPTALTHLRPTDTHAPIMLEPGAYELRIAREYDPYEKLARQVAD